MNGLDAVGFRYPNDFWDIQICSHWRQAAPDEERFICFVSAIYTKFSSYVQSLGSKSPCFVGCQLGMEALPVWTVSILVRENGHAAHTKRQLSKLVSVCEHQARECGVYIGAEQTIESCCCSKPRDYASHLGTPSSVEARNMRMAISPRLAAMTLPNSFFDTGGEVNLPAAKGTELLLRAKADMEGATHDDAALRIAMDAAALVALLTALILCRIRAENEDVLIC
jgi:hypothetical protein